MNTNIKYFIRIILPFVVLVGGWVVVAQAQNNPRFRVVHASPEAPAADVYLDDGRIFSNLAYRFISHYESLTPGPHKLKVLPAGQDTNTPRVIEADFTFDAGKDYTLVAVGNLADLEFRQFEDDNNPSEGANKARLRTMHASPNSPTVDMCITEHTSCFITDLTFKNATSYATLDAGIYNLDVRQTGTNDRLLSVANLRFNDGVVYTIFLMGIHNSGERPLEMVITVDASRPPTYPPITGALIAPELLMIVISTMVTLGAGGWFVWQQFIKN